jgi:uncharacterized protein YlxP (DUF503 family)
MSAFGVKADIGLSLFLILQLREKRPGLNPIVLAIMQKFNNAIAKIRVDIA